MAKQRDNSLDAVCGLMIVYMIYGHICLWAGVEQVEMFPRLLFFFMPWFFFKSGMFYKARSWQNVISGGARTLLVPYVVFSIIGQFVFYVKWLINGETPWKDFVMTPLRTLLHEGAVLGNSPLWFLLTLFLVRVLFNGCFLLDKRLAIGLSLLMGVVAYFFRIINFHSFFYVPNVCAGLFFYGCGYMMRNKTDKKIVLLVSALLYLSYIILYPSYYDFRSNEIKMEVYPYCIAACIGAIVSVNSLFKRLVFLQKPFVVIGKNSITYYAVHWIVLGVSSLLFQNVMDLNGYSLFIAFVIANIVLLPISSMLCNRYCGWMIGK